MSYDAVIIGAGPAGLTAAFELAREGKTRVLVLEADQQVGGLSRTVNHKGNRIDIGGHRFFSKSDWVMRWWQERLPVADADERAVRAGLVLSYQGKQRDFKPEALAANDADSVMLVRGRLSRILFAGQFFDYPLKPGLDFVRKLGLVRCMEFGLSYAWAHAFPRRPERTLEDFFINRFGKALYLQFFKEYTEKVWGRACTEISAEWGAQRVKSLSIGKALWHALKKAWAPGADAKPQMTSLIEQFLYPKFGPGQMWEKVAEEFAAMGGELRMGCKVTGLKLDGGRVTAVRYVDLAGTAHEARAEQVISTMPVRELVAALEGNVPQDVRCIAQGLEYRDFITVGLLYKRLRRTSTAGARLVPDNWIYIQEPGVKVGRLQIFNNWSPHMVADPETVWLGLEFFCHEGDELWCMGDEQLRALGLREMAQIGIADEADALDGVVVRMPKAYPGYYGSYERFEEVRTYLDAIPNLFLVGRNGMHRYNNQDHSMLSARAAVDCILTGNADKSAIWAINVDDEYHEEKQDSHEGASTESSAGTQPAMAGAR
ncbi:MAG TPA: NAD(P)/FAD-dependent oxidoreductase [Rubrivivax sp.]|nr:NAD(P)/FAD-dependent oxidoreductase [Rubrivivax sp.]